MFFNQAWWYQLFIVSCGCLSHFVPVYCGHEVWSSTFSRIETWIFFVLTTQLWWSPLHDHSFLCTCMCISCYRITKAWTIANRFTSAGVILANLIIWCWIHLQNKVAIKRKKVNCLFLAWLLLQSWFSCVCIYIPVSHMLERCHLSGCCRRVLLLPVSEHCLGRVAWTPQWRTVQGE